MEYFLHPRSWYPPPDRPVSPRPWFLPVVLLLFICATKLPRKARIAIAAPALFLLINQIRQSSSGDNVKDFGRGTFIFGFVLKFIDFGILTRDGEVYKIKDKTSSIDRRQDVSRTVGGKPSYERRSIWRRFQESAELWLFTLRGIGWNWEVGGIQKQNPQSASYFVFRTSLRILGSYLVWDICKHAMGLFPYIHSNNRGPFLDLPPADQVILTWLHQLEAFCFINLPYQIAHTLTGKHWLQLSPGKVYWNLSEQGWAKAAWSFFGTWNCGATIFVHDDRGAFDPLRVLDILHKHPITTLCAPPTAYRQLVLQKSKKYLKENSPKSLSHCTGAGEPLNAGVIDEWQKMTGLEIFDGYGQTETVLTCGNFAGTAIRPGSMGKPTPGVPLKIISGEGRECEPGAEGDLAILVNGTEGGAEGFFGLFDGYIRPDGTLDKRIKSLGVKEWYLTGDRATRDEDGYYWFVGRADDVINSSGYRIGPFEVESTLKLHPGVAESAVVSSPDESRGEVVKAFVVLTSEYKESKDGNEIIKELQDFCKNNAAPYKYPRKIQLVDPDFLPKTISGKIKRNELKAAEWKKGKESKL